MQVLKTKPAPLKREEVRMPAASPSILLPAEPLLKNMDLRDIVRLLRRRRQLIVSVTMAVTLLALLASLMLTPQYRASAMVLIDPRKTNVMDMGTVLSGLPADNTVVRSEIDIITSTAVLDRVIDKLKLINDPELRPQQWWRSLNPLKFLSPQAVSPEEQLARDHSAVSETLAKRLRAENDGRSYSISISFASEDPKKAALIANSVADEYLVDQLEAKYDVTARATKWLDERLGDLKQQVEVAEKAVEDFRQQSKLIEINGATVATRQMDSINEQLTKARGETSQAEARLRSAQKMLQAKGGIDGAADVLASPLIQKLREQEADVRRQEAEMASKYGELHPKMINIRAQYRDLQNKIGEEVRKIIQSLANEVEIARAKENQLRNDLQNLEARAGIEMKDGVTLRQLQREADADRTLYESFLNRFKQTSEQEDLQVADSRIIARATAPLTPAFPKKWLFILVGLLFGGILGVALAYLVEYFDRGFRSASQIEEATGLPVVGIIPSLTHVRDQPPADYIVEKPLSFYSETLRTVRTAIHFSNVNHPPKVVMVTSAVPNEGKTTFCLSLARSLAMAGNKILLIDADLRCPRIAKTSGVSDAEGGLSALLSGASTFIEVMQPDSLVPNFDIIPAVGKAPNAQDLLGSQQMKNLLHEAVEKYDLVLIDTPPILAVSDAAMVVPVVDTTLFILRWATTPRDAALQALKQLSSFGCKMAGIAFTQVDMTQHAKYNDGNRQDSYHEYYVN